MKYHLLALNRNSLAITAHKLQFALALMGLCIIYMKAFCVACMSFARVLVY